jgi:hypothetical protein
MSNQPSLEQALNFTPAELAANRQGHLSDGQRRLLRRRSYYPVAAYSLLAVIILAALFGFLGGSNSPILFSQTGCLVSSPFILVIIFFAILGIRKWKQFNTDVTIGRVAGVSGKISMDMYAAGYGLMVLNLKVQGKKFNLTKPAMLALRNGESYTIYYAPTSKIVLSAEPADT